FGMALSDADANSYVALIKGVLASYERVDVLTEPKPIVKYPRTSGYRPEPGDNPLNAWYWRAEVKGAAKGPLAGRTVVLKDTTCLAGVPMMNGTAVLEGYVPEFDATIVERILDAGGTIVGKAACENLCFSGGSHTNHIAPVHNPHKHGYSAGGSSSGSAALVASGKVDMAMGGDQGGSIRIPSAWSGTYGIKPTYGLVPCTGMFPIEQTLDHAGPICASTADAALLLSVIAGRDPLDPRQFECETHDYRAAIGKGAKGLKIAVVKEGFGRPESEAAVDKKVRSAAARFEKLGATVTEVSIPMHLDGVAIWTAIAAEGAAELMIKGNGAGTNWQGFYPTSLMDAYARGWRSRPDDLPDTAKLVLFTGEYMQRRYHGHYYAKAQNLRRVLRRAYDAVLADYDLLLMPTTPMKAQPLPASGCPREEYMARALEMINNTCPTDASGHPAMSVPCGMIDGLPVGMMLIGRKFDEAAVLRASDAFETAGDWKQM
ncbi:MAG: amidase, partial [Rhodospirillaceae bacterium]|nr:amidase [Rhodospirillaceae bacterium]